jgi:hypothetical protein
MELVRKNPAVLIPLALLLAFLVFPLLEEKPEKATKQGSVAAEQFPSTGFPDYDWLPEQLKRQMYQVANAHLERDYYFYYYFKNDDLHQHFFLDDFGVKIIAEMPVTHEMALQRIEDKLYNAQARRKGRFMARDTNRYLANGPAWHQRLVGYIFPEIEADFLQLRVAIVEDTPARKRNHKTYDTTVYSLHEVDEPPIPIRGMEYFQQAVRKEAQLDQALALFDTGTITVEFFVGHRAQVIDIVSGLEDGNDSYEAYQADSEFMKAVHNAKVWWKPASIQGEPVLTKMQITFQIDSNQVSSVVHQPPSI